MKVLLVNGSPHKNGCTYTALCEVSSALNENGISTDIFWIGNKPISGCIACRKCQEKNKCILDDIVNEFLEIAGDSIIHDLKEGEVLYCNSGNVVAFEDAVDFDITLVKRMSTLLFGGEGNFLVKLTGPGKIILQTQNQMQKVKIYENQ